MAKFDLKFLDVERYSWIKTFKDDTQGGEFITIDLYDESSGYTSSIYLDKSTAIKFAKTLRTEINKIQE